MITPLQFDWDASPDETSSAQEARFVEQFPGARYVVLRIDRPEELAALVRDMTEWPDHDLLTPCQENRVRAALVAVLGSLDG